MFAHIIICLYLQLQSLHQKTCTEDDSKQHPVVKQMFCNAVECWVNHFLPLLSYIIIIIIILSRYQHGYSWPSLARPPYRPSLSADPQTYISYRHRDAVYRLELDVLLLLVHVKGFTGVHHSQAHPYFSSSFPRGWFV